MNKTLDMKYWYRSLKYLYSFVVHKKLLSYNIGRYVMVNRGVTIARSGFKAGDCVHLGRNTYIGPNVELGNFCLISDNVNFIGLDHIFDKAGIPTILAGRPEGYGKYPATVAGDDVWIGHGTVIMRGTRLGEGSVIGANSVVTKDVEPYTVVAGVPARKIRDRFAAAQRLKHANFLKKYREGGIILLHDRKFIFKPAP